MKKVSKPKSGYLIHYVCNCLCPECNEYHEDFPEYLCNAHTHGMDKYGVPDFQIVLDNQELVSYTFKELAKRVQSGEIFAGGECIDDLFENNKVKLLVFKEADRNVLRVIFPDPNNKWPNDKGCEYPYNQQFLPTDKLTKTQPSV